MPNSRPTMAQREAYEAPGALYNTIDLPKPEFPIPDSQETARPRLGVRTSQTREGERAPQSSAEGAQSSSLQTSSFIEEFDTNAGITQDLLTLCATEELKGLATQCGILDTISEGASGGHSSQAGEALSSSTGSVLGAGSPAVASSPATNGGATTTGKRPSPETRARVEPTKPPPKKRRTMSAEEKKQKGLRHFSMLVLKKVEERGQTSYNEVADDVVASIRAMPTDDMKNGKPRSDQNIKRRVYDALNVLQAMKIIEKQKKIITWVGLPSQSTTRVQELQQEKDHLREVLQQKRDALRETSRQVELYTELARHNSLNADLPMEKRISIPFILVSTQAQTVIDCEIAEDRTEYCFRFNNPFQMYNDTQLISMIDDETRRR